MKQKEIDELWRLFPLNADWKQLLADLEASTPEAVVSVKALRRFYKELEDSRVREDIESAASFASGLQLARVLLERFVREEIDSASDSTKLNGRAA